MGSYIYILYHRYFFIDMLLLHFINGLAFLMVFVNYMRILLCIVR